MNLFVYFFVHISILHVYMHIYERVRCSTPEKRNTTHIEVSFVKEKYVYESVCIFLCTHIYYTCIYAYIREGFLFNARKANLTHIEFSFAKEPYKRDLYSAKETQNFCNVRSIVNWNYLLVLLETVVSIHCNTLQHTETHCNTLQHTALLEIVV